MVTHVIHFPKVEWYSHERFTGAIVEQLLRLDSRLELRFFAEERTESEDFGYWTFTDGTRCEGLMCDFFVVESLQTGRFKVVDFQDSYTITWGLSQSPRFVAAAVMMFHPPTILERYKEKAHQIFPGWFLDQTPSYVQQYRDAVAAVRAEADLDPRLFFRGTIHGETPNKEYLRGGRNIREVALVLREKYPDEVDISGHKQERPEWFMEAARHRWVLTLPGHPWCYREFEMMSLGIPTITLRWTSYLYHQPVHYVAVDGLEQDPIGFALNPERAADAIIAKHRQVRDDETLMRSVGAQAQRWYERHCSIGAVAEDVLTFLDLDRL